MSLTARKWRPFAAQGPDRRIPQRALGVVVWILEFSGRKIQIFLGIAKSRRISEQKQHITHWVRAAEILARFLAMQANAAQRERNNVSYSPVRKSRHFFM